MCSWILTCGFVAEARALDLGVAWVGQSAMAERVLAGFEATKDGMLLLRSSGAEFLAANPPKIPAFIGAASNPELLGVVRDMAHPEGRVTGVTYYIPYDLRLGILAALLPVNARVHLLVEEGHPASEIDTRGTLEMCPRLGLECSVGRYAGPEAAAAGVRELAGRVDGFLIGSQAGLLDHAGPIVAAAGDRPVFAYGGAAVAQGAVAGYVADDAELGRLLAESVVDVLVHGRPVSAVPVKTDPTPTLVVNGRAAETLGLEVPPDLAGAVRLIEQSTTPRAAGALICALPTLTAEDIGRLVEMTATPEASRRRADPRLA